MIPDNVTLVVKAPNQQIDDQNIECLSSWTVGQLKGHLSDVYPSKPTTDEQKIIYSGQLLDDNAVLKDVLRTYETQLTHFTHTMHLVCTPKRTRAPESRPTTAPVATDGLRRRNVEVPPRNIETVTRPETRQNDQNHTAESIQRYLQSAALPTPPDAASLHNHVLMMQQAYMQYMQQYAQMWQAGGNVAPAAQPMNVVNEVPQPPAEAAAPAEEPEEARRDWLDHVYAVSRLIVLVSLVHLYSSFYRLVVVLLLCVVAYLHQTGYFRDFGLGANQPGANQPGADEAPPREAPQANVNNANAANVNNANAANVNNANGANVNNANAANVNNANVANVNNANAANANVDNATPPPPATPPPNGNHQQSLLEVTWMIFSSFFASLIPEVNQ